MGGLNIGIGLGLRYISRNPISSNKFIPPSYLSCFGTGIWENEGYWFGDDTWKNKSTNPPFLPNGVWNNEGVYRFKDKFNFGQSFLPTGLFLFDLIYRYDDKIKIEDSVVEVELNHAEHENEILDKIKSYWNF